MVSWSCLSLFSCSHESLWCSFHSWPLPQVFFPSHRGAFHSVFYSGLTTKKLCGLGQVTAPLRASLFLFVKWNSLIRNFLAFLSALTFSFFWTLSIWKVFQLLIGMYADIIPDAHRNHSYLPLSLNAKVQWLCYSSLQLSELIKELWTSVLLEAIKREKESGIKMVLSLVLVGETYENPKRLLECWKFCWALCLSL